MFNLCNDYFLVLHLNTSSIIHLLDDESNIHIEYIFYLILAFYERQD